MDTVFDSEGYMVINEVRKAWLLQVLNELPFGNQLKTALDVGCGAGYFSEILRDKGMEVSGIDLQEGNIRECRERYPEMKFNTVNLDQPFEETGPYDLVLLFGILYHLQSPLQTILNLRNMIGRVGIVSTRTASGDSMACYLHHEFEGAAHNTARVTAVPTLAAYVRMFNYAGFDYVYVPKYQPNHPQWIMIRNGQRYSFIVSKEPIEGTNWQLVKAPNFINKWDPILIPAKV